MNKDPGTILGMIYLAAVLIIIFLPMAERWHKGKLRSKAFRKAAEKLGFDFAEKSDIFLNSAAKQCGLWDYLKYPNLILEILGIYLEKIRNVAYNISISHGEMKIFDFYYAKRYKSRFKSIKTCAFAEFDIYTNFPKFAINPVPADFFNRAHRKIFGPGNTDFDTYREFSEKYYLHCCDEEKKGETLRLLSPSVITALEKTKDLTIYANGRHIAYCSSDGGIKPEELASFAEEAKNVIQMIYSNLCPQNLSR